MRKCVGESIDDLADRRGVVEDVAEVAAQARGVERARAGQRDLLADREQQLDVHRRALAADVAREREQHRHGGLVVGAEDAVVGVLPAAVDEHRLDGRAQRHRVEVRAQQQRAPLGGRSTGGVAAGPRRDAREQVAAVGAARAARRRPRATVDAERAQLGDHALGARALAPGRALDPAQLGERAVQVRRRSARGRATAHETRGAPHSPARAQRSAADEVAEQRRRALGARLELGVELRGDEERVVVELDHLDQALVRRGAGHAQAGRSRRRLRSRLLTS